MNQHDPHESDEFEDPALRSAIRRACRGPAAPARLRERIEALMAAGAGVAPRVNRPSHGGRARWAEWIGASLLKTAAAAAVCFIAVGLASVQIWATFRPEPRPVSTPRVAFPVSLTAELVRTHDACAKLPDHHLVAGDNAAALLVQLAHLQISPPADMDFGSGWQFKGAGVCSFNGGQAVHLLFRRGKASASVFCLGAPRTCRHGTSGVYHQVIDGHPIAGFVFGGSLYAVVASGPDDSMTLADVDPLAAQVENCVGAGSIEGLAPATATAATTASSSATSG
jgi:hypothetical protein